MLTENCRLILVILCLQTALSSTTYMHATATCQGRCKIYKTKRKEKKDVIRTLGLSTLKVRNYSTEPSSTIQLPTSQNNYLYPNCVVTPRWVVRPLQLYAPRPSATPLRVIMNFECTVYQLCKQV